jgi:hypothetical protein
MSKRVLLFVTLTLSFAGCQKADDGGPDAGAPERVRVEQLCDAYAKGDARFTGKKVIVTRHYVSYGSDIGSDQREVKLGSDREGNSLKWLSFKVPGFEFSHVSAKQFGDLVRVEGVCVRANKSDDAIMVTMRDCHFVEIESEKKSGATTDQPKK